MKLCLYLFAYLLALDDDAILVFGMNGYSVLALKEYFVDDMAIGDPLLILLVTSVLVHYRLCLRYDYWVRILYVWGLLSRIKIT